jgi:predicted DNA-binding protein (MmcQ/YjbR family)
MANAKRGAGAKREQVRSFALEMPDSYEDFPWGESVVKVNKKVFVFLGGDQSDPPPGMSVKLRDSHDEALDSPGASPTGYGLGRAGWVSVRFGAGSPPIGVLRDWVEESYRIVAPKRVAARLDDERTAKMVAGKNATAPDKAAG